VKQRWMSRLARGAILSFAVLASVATSSVPRPRSTFQVDLITRETAVYELSAIDAPDGGFEALGLTLFAEQSAEGSDDGAGLDGGAPAPEWRVRVGRVDSQPTRDQVQAFASGESAPGIEVLGELASTRSSLTPRVPVTTEPRWILFSRTGPGVLVTASMLSPCERGCGYFLLEDVTLNLP
jgi:hypothetical protein